MTTLVFQCRRNAMKFNNFVTNVSTSPFVLPNPPPGMHTKRYVLSFQRTKSIQDLKEFLSIKPAFLVFCLIQIMLEVMTFYK